MDALNLAENTVMKMEILRNMPRMRQMMLTFLALEVLLVFVLIVMMKR